MKIGGATGRRVSMKEKTRIDKDQELTKLLQAWKVDAQLSPRFQEAVWHRIERSELPAPIPFWAVVASWLEAAFARPALGTAYIALLLFAGVGAGYWHVGDRVAQANSALRARYVQTVDPYQMPRN
jgi:hypothetical protein